nr:hypothetical protein [Tanacetum cinerariifolium]
VWKGLKASVGHQDEKLPREGLCHVLAHTVDKGANVKNIQNIPIERNRTEVFLKDLSGPPSTRIVEFQIDLVLGAAPVTKALYRLASTQISTILGHVVNTKGIHVDPAKIEAIKKWGNITIDLVTKLPRTSRGHDTFWEARYYLLSSFTIYILSTLPINNTNGQCTRSIVASLDAKTLWEAIKTRFGGNKESKKMQKTILKQQYKNFVASRSEGLDKTYDRHFARECMATRSQGNRNGDNTRRVVPVETPANTLVVTNGMGYDWSYQAEEGPTDFALMAFSSSGSSSSDSKENLCSIMRVRLLVKGKNFVPTAVITNSRKVPVNVAKQSSPRAAASTSTTRYVNTAENRPTVNVVSVIQGNGENAVKSSACWIWRPTCKDG